MQQNSIVGLGDVLHHIIGYGDPLFVNIGCPPDISFVLAMRRIHVVGCGHSLFVTSSTYPDMSSVTKCNGLPVRLLRRSFSFV